MKLSIITVTYNNVLGLEATIQSVASQRCKDFEYIVVDGGSNDGSADLIKRNSSCITKWISEPDSGIYNAMNKGVRIATGDYCLFMNSGDLMYSPTTVEEILQHPLNADFVEGKIAFNNKPGMFSNPPKERTLWSYIYGWNNCHQASLISRKMLLEIPYDESYKIAADLKFNLDTIICHNCSYDTLDVVICNYEVGGRSATISHRDEVDRVYEELFPSRILEDYKRLEFHKFWPASYFWRLSYKIAHLYSFFRFRVFIKKILNKDSKEFDTMIIDEMKKWSSRY